MWSAQFRVSRTCTRLPGDKLLLPPSALEALLSAHQDHVPDQKHQLPHPLTFRLLNPQNGRVVYAGVKEFTAGRGEAVLSPFLLETLGLDVHETTEAATLTVHAKQLPKGTFVKLRPLEAGYDAPDWKALLEHHLRQNYTTLTHGEVLVVPGGSGAGGEHGEFRFVVDELRPDADGICIVDTDLEVDMEALDEEQARDTLKTIAANMTRAPATAHGTSPGGELDIFNPRHGQVLPGEYVDYRLSAWDKSQALELELSGEDHIEHLDLLLNPFSPTQRAKPRLDQHVFADFDGRPAKRIRLEQSHVELETAEALFVSVHAYSPLKAHTNGDTTGKDAAPRPSHFTLRARHPHPDDEKDSALGDEVTATPPHEGDVRCKNCAQWVPRRTLMLHENFCLRNNILCPQGCSQVFQNRSPEWEQHWHCPHDSAYGNTLLSHQKHDTLNHPTEVLRCSECATHETFASISTLAQHRTTACPSKLILCRFCHLVVPQEGDPDNLTSYLEAQLSGLTPHEVADGARTTECHLCDKIVRLRDMATHLKNHDLDRFSRPPPIPCRNVHCGRTLDTCSKRGDTRTGTRTGQGPGNDMGLCSVCFGPLYVSMYDPEGKALRRRVERRYLQQLVTGCGKAWCRNEYCKAGRQHLGIEGALTTKDALPMVKPMLVGLAEGDPGTRLHFCVDEKAQKSRALAEMLAAERGVKGEEYELHWCVGALEAEGGDVDGARAWLRNFAPTKQEAARRC